MEATSVLQVRRSRRRDVGRLAALVVAAALAGAVASELMRTTSPHGLFQALHEGKRRSSRQDLERMAGLLQLQTSLPSIASSVTATLTAAGTRSNARVVLADTNVGYCLLRIGANMTCQSRREATEGRLWVLSVDRDGREEMVIAVPNDSATVTAFAAGGRRLVAVHENLVFLGTTHLSAVQLGSEGPLMKVPHPGPALLKRSPG